MEKLACAPPGYFELGRKLFSRECWFLWAASNPAQLPAPFAPEIAFAGRSNAGKSSLLNALTARKKLARISKAPGRTRELHFFGLGCDLESVEICLVDLPGYGYAAAPKEMVASWSELTGVYLRGRPGLLRVFLLIDGRLGAKPIDAEMMAMLDRAGVSYQIVLTKQDEVKPAEREERLAATYALIGKRPAAFSKVIFTSSRSGDGIGDLRAEIAKLMVVLCRLGEHRETSADTD